MADDTNTQTKESSIVEQLNSTNMDLAISESLKQIDNKDINIPSIKNHIRMKKPSIMNMAAIDRMKLLYLLLINKNEVVEDLNIDLREYKAHQLRTFILGQDLNFNFYYYFRLNEPRV